MWACGRGQTDALTNIYLASSTIRAKRNKKDARLTASFPQQPGQGGTRNVKPIWILLKQEMMGWQCHQLDHMQINCTSLQTDNHGSTSLLNFCRLDALSSNSIKALKAIPTNTTNYLILSYSNTIIFSLLLSSPPKQNLWE